MEMQGNSDCALLSEATRPCPARHQPEAVDETREEIRRSLGYRIRDRRIELEKSQEELAAETGLHRTEISLLERGRREPRLAQLIKLADALQWSPDDLAWGMWHWETPTPDERMKAKGQKRKPKGTWVRDSADPPPRQPRVRPY